MEIHVYQIPIVRSASTHKDMEIPHSKGVPESISSNMQCLASSNYSPKVNCSEPIQQQGALPRVHNNNNNNNSNNKGASFKSCVFREF